MPRGFIRYPADGTGKSEATYDRGAEGHAALVVQVDDGLTTYNGRLNTFRIPGRAGTTGQKLAAIHNATGSAVLVRVNRVMVDLAVTVAKVVTVMPPSVRVHRFTALPTGGTTMAKVAVDTLQATSASVTGWQDASADGTSSATALTITIPANSMLTQEFAARLVTASYEPFDRTVFFDGKTNIILRALEGVVVNLDYTLATQNPTTDIWTVTFDVDEYTF